MKKIILILMMMVICASSSFCIIADDEPLQVTITSDHSEYSLDENINIKVELENHGDLALKDLDLKIEPASSLSLIKGNQQCNDLTLNSKGKYDTSLDLMMKSTPTPAPKPSQQTNAPTSKPQNTTTAKPNQNMGDVKTGDTSQMNTWIILVEASLLVMVIVVVAGKKQKVWVVVMAMALATSSLSLPIAASENKNEVILVHKFLVDGKQQEVKVVVTYVKEEAQQSTNTTTTTNKTDTTTTSSNNSDDRDQDGLSNDDEIVLGLNPDNPKSDGKTLDSERKIAQVLSDSKIDDEILRSSLVVPSLMVTTSGNINKTYAIKANHRNDVQDTRAIVGSIIDISGTDFTQAVLTFSLSEGINDVEDLIICEYSNQKVTYLETTYDATTHSINASIDKASTYYVLNAKVLLNELGVDTPLQASVMSVNTNQLSTQTNKAMAQADIVFIVDSTASMQEEIDNVKNNIQNFVNDLKQSGISPAFALVSYQDLAYDGIDSTKVYQHQNNNWFYDLDAYRDAIASIELGHGGDMQESVIDALETARELDMRSSAGKVFVLLTDAGYKVENRYNIPSMDAMIHLLKNAQVQTSVITSSKYKQTYASLYEKTNGTYLDIKSDFATNLSTLVEQLSNEIVGDGYWIYLDGPVPLPVRLDAKPTANSNVDTDHDGVRDIDELTSINPSGSVDLDELITRVSKGTITNTNYGIVETYTYYSNPILADSDYDGVIDIEDNMPTNNEVKGIVYYETDDDSNHFNVDFNMDYRMLIDSDNIQYSQAISKLAVLYSAEVYTKTHVQITEGNMTGGNDTGVELGNMLGMQDSQMIHISSYDYDVDQDDVTSFYIGHKDLIYNGKKEEVIVLSIRGTNGTNTEWSSNFDIGADTQNYYSMVGASHPHWLNKQNHKGFDVSANRVMEKVEAYLSKYVDMDANLNILVTGHSRGAAIANIIGAKYEKDDRFNSYTYTYASPNTTTASDATSYKTIFNIVNTDDIITYLPLEAWGFTKYGTTKALSVEEYYENEFGAAEEGTWEWLMNGTDYNDDSLTQDTLNKIKAIVNNREDLYVLETADIGKVWEDDLGHTTLKGAQEEVEALKVALTNEKLLKFCNIYTTKWGLLYYAEINYCPAYLLQTLANMTTGVGPLLGRDVAGKYATAKTAFVASSGKVIIGGMTHPHIPGTYYLMVRNDLKPLP